MATITGDIYKKYKFARKFHQPYQYKQVNTMTSDIIYSLELLSNEVGFIEFVANSWYEDTSLLFLVDGENVEFPRIERQIAPINEPLKYDPPILFKDKIEWHAENNSGTDHVFEVYCDGIIYYV